MAALVFLDRDSLSVRLKQSQFEEKHQKNKHKDVAMVSIRGSPRSLYLDPGSSQGHASFLQKSASTPGSKSVRASEKVMYP